MSRVRNPKELLPLDGAGVPTPQTFTDTWADVGSYLPLQYADELVTRLAVTKNSSANLRFRLAEFAVTGGTAFIPQIETIGTSDIKIEDQYVELNVDANKDILLKWDIKGMVWGKLQIQAGTVGTTGGTLDECKYNLVRED